MTCLDVGCGGGHVTLLMASMVGPEGKVTGTDADEQIVALAQEGADAAKLDNVEFRQGYMEELPIDDATADVVISNGVINLSPDREAVFREIARVLKPGGRIQIADIIVARAVPDSAKENIDL